MTFGGGAGAILLLVDQSAGDQEVMVVVVSHAGRSIDPHELIEFLIPQLPPDTIR